MFRVAGPERFRFSRKRGNALTFCFYAILDAKPLRTFAGIALMVLALLSSMTAASADRRVALVLGNSQYQHAAALPNPVRDAQAMAERLRTLGFEVVSGFDLTKQRTQTTVAQFAKQVRGADVALFFYAGHGLQVSGKNYLLPVDAALEDETSLDFEAVSIDFVLRQMSRETSIRLVFLDACRDNPLAEILAKTAGVKGASSGLAEIPIENGGAGTLVAFAASPNQLALDGSGDHSPFTKALLQHIGEPNISITEAVNRVTSDVFKATNGKQRPWINVSLTTEVLLHKVDLNAPLIVGEAHAPQDEANSGTRNTGVSTSQNDDQLALDVLRQKIPKLATDEPIFFDRPIKFGDPAIDGKSIAQLIKSEPLFSPVEGLDKSMWQGKHCDGCHQWNEARICEQAKNFATNDVSVMRLQHPLGTRFKVALAKWAQSGCK
ncbi:peptidase c14 caspase catalytic subunit p20 [Mesorhizobium loti]|nr:peptidase c14 caspase catalytic subunit p20 [Mesorhizobium loti]